MRKSLGVIPKSKTKDILIFFLISKGYEEILKSVSFYFDLYCYGL